MIEMTRRHGAPLWARCRDRGESVPGAQQEANRETVKKGERRREEPNSEGRKRGEKATRCDTHHQSRKSWIAAATQPTCSSVRSGYMGRLRHSRAARSVWGNAPAR